MVGERSGPKLAGIRPAPLCREQRRTLNRMASTASSLPSLARLGMFKAVNDPKSLFIHRHMRAATAAALTKSAACMKRAEGFGVTPEGQRVSEPLAVMTTEMGLDDYRRRQRAEHWGDVAGKPRRRSRCERHVPLLGDDRYRRSRLRQRNKRMNAYSAAGESFGQDRPATNDLTKWRREHDDFYDEKQTSATTDNRHQAKRRTRGRRRNSGTMSPRNSQPLNPRGDSANVSPAINTPRCVEKKTGSNSSYEGEKSRLPAEPIIKISNVTGALACIGGGSLLVHADGAVSKSRFPRGDIGIQERLAGGILKEQRAIGGVWRSHWAGETPRVVRRLCDPKMYTGTAATGHLPVTVDLEDGVNVLLKDASIAVKDHVGTQEISWRLRLAERL